MGASRTLATVLVAVVAAGVGVSPVGALSGAETVRVSVSSTGTEGGRDSRTPSISGNGRVVAFASKASNLVADDTNRRRDIFVYDGSTQETRRVSVSSAGTEGNAFSGHPAISADGRFVTFASGASNLVAHDTNRDRDVFVYDRTTERMRRVSVSSRGIEGNAPSGHPAISAHGRFVAFASNASNLVPADTNRNRDVFVYDLTTHGTRRISASSTGGQGNRHSSKPAISAHGRFVAFASKASNLVKPDTNRTWDVFVYDRATHRTRMTSVSSAGVQGKSYSTFPSIAANGRFVTFTSNASNLVPGDTNDAWDVFVYDRTTHRTRRVSVSSGGTQGNRYSFKSSISSDGQFVAFNSDAFNLVKSDTNERSDVFVRDLTTHTTRRVSLTSTGAEGGSDIWSLSISADGRFVAFDSWAPMVEADTNRVADVFVRGPLS